MGVWGIDIGHAALKAVKLNPTKEGLEIAQAAYIPMESGGEDGEENRPEQVRAALRTFLSQHKVLASDRVAVSLPGLNAFTRPIKLPPVDAKKIDEMVVYEAQQQIPFPIEEVMWGYHKIDRVYEPGEEVEVVIFATKKDLILGFLSELKENNIAPDIVTIAPLAILNYVNFNTPMGEGTIVLDIGAEHMDLILTDGTSFWIRNLRIAGKDVTAALAERFKIPMHEAERLKRQGSQSKNADKIFRSMEGVLKDFTGEIHRSISFFKNQAGDLQVKRMRLLGDAAKLKTIKPFFEKELKFKVSRCMKLEQDRYTMGQDVEFDTLKSHILSFGVALGLATQGANRSMTTLNLLPQEDLIKSALKRKVPMAAAAAGIAWLAFLLSFFFWSGAVGEIKATIKSSSGTAKYKDEHEKAKAAENIADLEKKADKFRYMLAGRLMPLKLLQKLRAVLPQKNAEIVTLTEAERGQAAFKQADLIKTKRAAAHLDDSKYWLLSFAMERVDLTAPPGENESEDDEANEGEDGEEGGGASKKPRVGYKVSIVVARRMKGAVSTTVYDKIRKEVADRIQEAFAGEPYWVRKPDTERRDPKIPEVKMDPGKDIYALDASADTPEGAGAGPEQFRCLSVPIRFLVGIPPKPAKKAKKDGEEDPDSEDEGN